MRYFDFHSHVYFKQAFDSTPNLNGKINRGDVGGVPHLCTDLPNIIQTQIHQSQLSEFEDEVIIGAVLYGMESFLAEKVKPLRKFLRSSSQHKLSDQLLDEVANNTCHAFSDFVVTRTLDVYTAATESFNVLTGESFAQDLPRNKVNIFFVVEGCHSLVDTHNKYLPPEHFFPVEEILSNLDKLLAQIFIMSVNPTHLQQSNLCNHAFGMQIAEVSDFVPRGNGLQEDGRKVVQGIFDRGICVDLKHMSYKSRRDLMQEIDKGDYSNAQPLVCTHTGFTGIPFSKWPGLISIKKPMLGQLYIETVKSIQVANDPHRPGAPTFNATTINLFDEEIAWIVQHGGIIGLSLDRRIIGFVSKFDDHPTGIRSDFELVVDKEYFSKDEWSALEIPPNKIGKGIEQDDVLTLVDLEENTEISVDARNEYFSDHVLLHIKHFFQACVNAGISVATAQKHLTFGSDFDGLINPFLNIDTVEAMTELKKYISMNLGFYLHSLTDARVWEDQLDIPAFVEDLFYNNGFNYVKQRMTSQ